MDITQIPIDLLESELNRRRAFRMSPLDRPNSALKIPAKFAAEQAAKPYDGAGYDSGEAQLSRSAQGIRLDQIFSYHPPSPDLVPRYQAIRSAARHLAEVILDNTLPCNDQSNAIDNLRVVVMLANSSIALNGSR